jgi:GWxTD domain-containing protein
MFRQRAIHRVLAALVLTAIIFPSNLVWSQNKKDKDKNQDPLDRPRNVKTEVKQVYKKWVDEDVAYIITDQERKVFKKLATDEEREAFIEQFWRMRDRDPDTEANEYREEYYERMAYANERFASGIPGWKTDRGRIYIAFGKPDSIESHPSGGSYDRPFEQGGGTTATYPFEVWFYRHIEGIGSGIEIEFVDPTGSGEYRIARSPNEKDALLHVPGAGLTLSEQLGLSDKADRIAGIHSDYEYRREQDNPFTKLQLLHDLQKPPKVKFTELNSLVNTPVIDENPLPFDVRVDYFRQSDERVVTAFTIQTENKNLTFEDVGGVQTARMNIFGQVTAVTGKRAGIFEDPVVATATVSELTEAKGRKSAYQKAVALAPGRYKLDVVVRDVNSGATGVQHLPVVVPKFEPQKLGHSSLVLAARLHALSDQSSVGQFVIGNIKVIPNVAKIYRKGEPVGIYMQVYNAGIDQTTLRPAVDVEYVLMKDGKEIGKQAEDWKGLSDSGQRLTLARLIPTTNLAKGEYEIVVRIKDKVSNQSLSPSEKFTIND